MRTMNSRQRRCDGPGAVGRCPSPGTRRGVAARLRHPPPGARFPGHARSPRRSAPGYAADQPARHCAGVRRIRLTPVSSHSVATLCHCAVPLHFAILLRSCTCRGILPWRSSRCDSPLLRLCTGLGINSSAFAACSSPCFAAIRPRRHCRGVRTSRAHPAS
jgi:hypothetical protein